MTMGAPFMDQAVHRVAVSGPILAHILQDFGASRGDCDGVLFGHLQKTISPKLEDDDEQSGMQEELTAIITGFFCSGSVFSFYNACGRIDPAKLLKLAGDRESRGGDPLIGWFSGRHNTPMRPSLRETAVTRYLRLFPSGFSVNKEGSASPYKADGGGVAERTLLRSPTGMLGSPVRATRSSSQMMESPSHMQENQMHAVPLSGGKASPIDLDSPSSDIGSKMQAKFFDGQQSGSQGPSVLDTLPSSSLKCACVPPSSPCLFMLLTESGAGHAVHTHDYKVYQYHSISQTFEPRAMKIVNIGPAFRVQYDSFSPVAAFPLLLSTGEEESESNSSSSTGLNAKRRELHQGSRRMRVSLPKEQALLDVYSEGYKVERLASLADPDGLRQVPELEDLYSKMLLKLEILAKQVCESSAALIQQENANKQLRLNATSVE
eukprot:c17135_g1_i1 orf=431-1732(-)